MIHSVLLIGLGQVGMGYDLEINDRHVAFTHARAFATHPAFHLAGGVDPRGDRREAFTRHYGAPAYADMRQALHDLNPQVVVIATPTESHADAVAQVFAHAPRTAVLMEKPLAYDAQQAAAMVRLAREHDGALSVNYLRRAAPAAHEIRQRVASGAIAGPIKGVAWYSKGLLHNGSHIVNLLEFWLGPISGFAVIGKGRDIGSSDCEPDVQIDFAAGSVVLMAAREENYSLHEIDLIAANGRLSYRQGGSDIVWRPAVPDAQIAGYKILSGTSETIPNDTNKAQWYVADKLAAALDGSETDLCSGEQALETLNWLIRIRDAKISDAKIRDTP